MIGPSGAAAPLMISFPHRLTQGHRAPLTMSRFWDYQMFFSSVGDVSPLTIFRRGKKNLLFFFLMKFIFPINFSQIFCIITRPLRWRLGNQAIREEGSCVNEVIRQVGWSQLVINWALCRQQRVRYSMVPVCRKYYSTQKCLIYRIKTYRPQYCILTSFQNPRSILIFFPNKLNGAYHKKLFLRFIFHSEEDVV